MPSDIIKTDITYKKLSKKQYTSLNKKWYEENPGNAFSIKFKDIWTEPLPATPPVSSTDIIEVINLVLTEDVTVDNALCWIACSTPNVLTTRIGDFIQPDKDLSNAYNIKIFDDNNTRIYVGDPVSIFILKLSQEAAKI